MFGKDYSFFDSISCPPLPSDFLMTGDSVVGLLNRLMAFHSEKIVSSLGERLCMYE